MEGRFLVSFLPMTKLGDKFEATRTVVETVKDFDQTEQEMIFRWAAESLGLPNPFQAAAPPPTRPPQAAGPSQRSHQAESGAGSSSQDIQSFVKSKNPSSDMQF